jgi:uncharacterized protein YecE (DUF72 family)
MSMFANARRMEAPRIGTAGWSIPKQHAAAFAASGSHLERYAQRLNAVEINSSFYRPHRRATYERWAATVPEDFAFAVKAPRAITHDARLADAQSTLERFLGEATGLGAKLGPLLFQLPPNFAFDARTARTFLKALRARHDGPVAWEPRHPTWFTPHAERLLIEHRIARVAADPAVVPAAAEPAGWGGLRYFRLHGVPRIYYSDYGADTLARYARRMTAQTWCIFDNTALGAATANALALSETVAANHPRRKREP